MKEFENLFQPVTIGKLTIKNRIAMAPIVLFGMPLYNHQLQSMTRDGVEYYARRARGGVGQIITSGFKVPHDVEQPGWPELRPEGLTALSEMVDMCHTYDCKVFIQLTPGTGRNLMPSQLAMGLKPISSSALPSVWDPGIICRALTNEEVKKIINSYKPAAEMVAVTGIDGIEVHSHEGYLLDQFITPFYNRRTDEYGGSFENRMRLPIDILHVIKGTLGDDFPVTFRLGIKHFLKDLRVGAMRAKGYEEKGRDIDDTHRIIKRLEEEGYDGFHLDAGCYDAWFWAHPPIYMGHGPHLDYIKGVKDVVKVPIITASRLGLPEVAEKVIKEGLADIVAVGRALLSDPDFPKKLEKGDPDDIRPCIGCHDGCFGHVINLARGLSCSVNPACGRELYYGLLPAVRPKSIIVIGGGPAGMETARVAMLRGHRVTLYEKDGSLGGHLREGSIPDFKYDVKRLLDWYRVQMERLKIDIKLNMEVTGPTISELKAADIVVLATGSGFIIPDIKGVDGKNVVTVGDTLLGKAEIGDEVIVIGGGLEGCETALWLADNGKNVTLLEKLNDLMLAHPVFYTNRNYLMGLMGEANVITLTNINVEKITDGGVIITQTAVADRSENQDIYCKGKERTLRCDTVVLAVGQKPENGLYRTLHGKVRELYKIGDCRTAGKIHDAILAGFNLGRNI